MEYKALECCVWELENEDFNTYETECSQLFSFLAGNPKDNKYRHCPWCGKIIMVMADYVQKFISH